MNISSSVGQAANIGQLQTANVSNKPNTLVKSPAQTGDPADHTRAEKEQSSNSQTVPSIVIDEQAIAIFEQSRSLNTKQDQFSQNSSTSASQDLPSAKNETAVANYQAVGNLAERESVQKMFGVDLFA